MLFDDKLWSAAFLMATIGGFFGGKRVLLPPTVPGRPDWRSKAFSVAYSREQINRCPGIHEIWTAGPGTAESLIGEGDPHVRSADQIKRSRAREIDGKLCQMRDIIEDDLAWAVRYLLVDAPGGHRRRTAMISPFRIRRSFRRKVESTDSTTDGRRRHV
jgi:hypothetical protein